MSVATRAGDVLRDATSRLANVAPGESRLEAELLLCHVLGIDRARLLTRLLDSVPQLAMRRFSALVARRLTHEPLSYIIGSCEFYGLEIECSPDALIPRPETEMLVDFALDEIAKRGSGVRLIDVGTGSGAIAVAIAASAAGVKLSAVDTSDDALRLALRNAERHGVAERTAFAWGDLLNGDGVFDVIVANLPYIAECEWTELTPEIRDHEPRSALVGGVRGVEVIERLIDDAPRRLAPDGAIALEIGDRQGAAVSSRARAKFPGAQVAVLKDLAGLDRVVVVRTAA